MTTSSQTDMSVFHSLPVSVPALDNHESTICLVTSSHLILIFVRITRLVLLGLLYSCCLVSIDKQNWQCSDQ